MSELFVRFKETESGLPLAEVSTRILPGYELRVALWPNGDLATFALPDSAARWPPDPNARCDRPLLVGTLTTRGQWPTESILTYELQADPSAANPRPEIVTADIGAVVLHASIAGDLPEQSLIESANFAYESLGSLAWLAGAALGRVTATTAEEQYLHRLIGAASVAAAHGQIVDTNA